MTSQVGVQHGSRGGHGSGLRASLMRWLVWLLLLVLLGLFVVLLIALVLLLLLLLLLYRRTMYMIDAVHDLTRGRPEEEDDP